LRPLSLGMVSEVIFLYWWLRTFYAISRKKHCNYGPLATGHNCNGPRKRKCFRRNCNDAYALAIQFRPVCMLFRVCLSGPVEISSWFVDAIPLDYVEGIRSFLFSLKKTCLEISFLIDWVKFFRSVLIYLLLLIYLLTVYSPTY
jgi:hypothetical protein